MSGGGTTPEAAPAVTELDGIALQPLEAANAGVVSALLRMRGHQFILDVPSDEASIAGLLGQLRGQPWTLPLAAVKDGECIGVATTALPNLKAMHAGLTALFVEPAEARLALAMCVRHLFWSFPLRRVHAQIPDMDLTGEYVELLEAVGFRVEGRLVDHLVVAGRSFDVVALGLLRSEFAAWCDTNEPRLALDAP